MFAIYNTDGIPYRPPEEQSRYASFEKACEAAQRLYSILHFEVDADWYGCADFITTSGQLFCIEPTEQRALKQRCEVGS